MWVLIGNKLKLLRESKNSRIFRVKNTIIKQIKKLAKHYKIKHFTKIQQRATKYKKT